MVPSTMIKENTYEETHIAFLRQYERQTYNNLWKKLKGIINLIYYDEKSKFVVNIYL